MKKRTLMVLIIIVCAVAVPLTAFADTGVGVIVGDPTGVSVLFNERIAIGAAWDVSKHLHLHGDLWMIKKTLSDPVNWYMGLGAKMMVYTDNSTYSPSWDSGDDTQDASIGMGVRVPFGLQWYAVENLEIFGEIVPALSIFPATGFDLDAGIGVRYHF